jgi:hypothetical protein
MHPASKWIVCALSCAIPLLWAACAATRAGYKTPAYTVKERFKGPVRFEIRDYPEMVLVETPTKAERNGRDGSFGRLFKFITGTNASGAKIPMTTPVIFRGKNESERMSFVMPSEMSADSVPLPADKLVDIGHRAKGIFAVMAISTKRDRAYLESMAKKLEASLEQTEYKPNGTPEFAYYDPPWIPAWFCRNECLIPVVNKKH